jgi:hypothetical protein
MTDGMRRLVLLARGNRFPLNVGIWMAESTEPVRNEVSHMIRPFGVHRSFEAIEPISGKKRRILSGEVVNADLGESGSDVTIEVHMSYFVVDFLTFDRCCKPIEGL